MGLSQLITSSQTSITGDDQGDWRQFVLDHLDYIAARSQRYDITPQLINLYRYDLGRFLKKNMMRSEDLEWIVLLVNNLPNDFAFVDPGVYIIPDDRLITNLYRSYRTISHNAR